MGQRLQSAMKVVERQTVEFFKTRQEGEEEKKKSGNKKDASEVTIIELEMEMEMEGNVSILFDIIIIQGKLHYKV